MDIEILEKFKSKRNNVYKVKIHSGMENRIAIMKKYNMDNEDLSEKEFKNIKMLQKSGISIPKIIYKSNDSIFLEYIQGELIEDLVERQCIGNWIDEFALWLANFHKISNKTGNLLKMDVNLRNFIYNRDKIYGLDFEDVCYGDIRTDLGNICFFTLTNTPSFTKEKHMIMRRFLQSYKKYSGIELKDMGRYLLKSKAEAKIRRCGANE